LAYGKTGRHREAVAAFEKATKIMPRYKQAWEHLAVEYRAVGRPADAARASAQAAQLKTNAPKIAIKRA
jgi:Flp pilus assembly protein TadD